MLSKESALLWITAMTVIGLLSGSPASASLEEQARHVLAQADVTGGLIVHLGSGQGRLTAALRVSDAYLVHGLDGNADNVATARRHIRSLGLYGPVSVQRLRSERLPYTDNLANLIVVERPGDVSRAEMLRVLAPNGVICTREGGRWTTTVKPRPGDIDEWTHFLHNPTNNAVSRDQVVAPPYHLQWVGDPKWARSHDHLATISAVVSAGGRLFYIADEGLTASVAFPTRWRLVARDAFNGVLLWKRPVGPWEGHLRGFRTGPAELPRRLVAVGNRVYVTLGYGKPVTSLDARTGEIVRTYPGTQGATEILYQAGVLFVVAGRIDAAGMAEALKRRTEIPAPHQKRLLAIDAASGDLLWRKADAETSELMPLTLAIADGRVYFQNTEAVHCLDATSGRRRWKARRPVSRSRWTWSTPTLVVHDGVVLSADRASDSAVGDSDTQSQDVQWTVSSRGGDAPTGELIAFSAETGRTLWSCACRETYNSPPDVFVADGLLWTGDMVRARDPGITVGRDPQTGLIARQRPADREFFVPGMGHHRCYRNKATDRYLLLGRSGVEFVDVVTGKAVASHWVRGGCQYGIMPANGLLYAPSHSCACFINSKLNGFNALAPKRKSAGRRWRDGARLEKGPAFGASRAAWTEAAWSTYRHDAARSGRTDAAVPTSLRRAWQTKLGDRLSSLVEAENKVFVASTDEHTVHALNSTDGRVVWSYTAGGRVDSPPTLYKGLALFGCADGYVYGVRARDGQLVWRFRAAPEDRFIVAYGQLESVWPVHGNVLVLDDVAYAAAGRSSFLDGGIYLYRLDPQTGRMRSQTCIDSRDPQTGLEPQDTIRGTNMPGALPDVLSSDGEYVYMRHLRFDKEGNPAEPDVPHLFSAAGFLDDSWWHRTYWFVGTAMTNGWGGWPKAGNQNPAGRLIVQDGSRIYGFARLNQYARHGSHVGLREQYLPWPRPGTGNWSDGNTRYYLYAYAPDSKAENKRSMPRAGQFVQTKWTREVPMLTRAMLLANSSDDHAGAKTLFIAGPPDFLTADRDGRSDPDFEKAERAFAGHAGGLLWAVTASDGTPRAKLPLPSPPVFDGMIAATGRLYLSLQDGSVMCMAARRTGQRAAVGPSTPVARVEQ